MVTKLARTLIFFFFLNDPPPPEIYPLPLPDPLPFPAHTQIRRPAPPLDCITAGSAPPPAGRRAGCLRAHARAAPSRGGRPGVSLAARPRAFPTTSRDRKSTRLNSSHSQNSYAGFSLK